MHNVIPNKITKIYHSNFPVSSNGIKNFKNPLGTVSFHRPQPLSFVKDQFKDGQRPWEMNDFHVKLGWQQPIIERTKYVTLNNLKMNDILIDAITPDLHKPFPVFETATIVKNGLEYNIRDKFSNSHNTLI